MATRCKYYWIILADWFARNIANIHGREKRAVVTKLHCRYTSVEMCVWKNIEVYQHVFEKNLAAWTQHHNDPGLVRENSSQRSPITQVLLLMDFKIRYQHVFFNG
jgi:hypothetical protein